MTLSFHAENRSPRTGQVNVLAHHDVYEDPESGCTLSVGGVSVHLTGEDTIRLGAFLFGGHAALNNPS